MWNADCNDYDDALPTMEYLCDFVFPSSGCKLFRQFIIVLLLLIHLHGSSAQACLRGYAVDWSGRSSWAGILFLLLGGSTSYFCPALVGVLVYFSLVWSLSTPLALTPIMKCALCSLKCLGELEPTDLLSLLIFRAVLCYITMCKNIFFSLLAVVSLCHLWNSIGLAEVGYFLPILYSLIYDTL